MAEKSNEELLDEFGRAAYSGKRDEAWNAHAAVLARMAGPCEVVVPKGPTNDMLDAASRTANWVRDSEEDVDYLLYDVREVYAAMLDARPNNGGNDDAAA